MSPAPRSHRTSRAAQDIPEAGGPRGESEAGSGASQSQGSSPPWLLPVVAIAAGVIVYHRALGAFFSQDDFLGLARAAGLTPRLVQPWRFVANQAVWDLLGGFGIRHPLPYHLFSLAAHAGCVARLYVLLARRVSRPAALLGAAYFATNPMIFSALYWFSTIGDPLALLAGLGALAVFRRTDGWRWLAVPAFAFSLLAKESLALLPAAALLLRFDEAGVSEGGKPRAGRARADAHRSQTAAAHRWVADPVWITLTALAAIYVVYFFAFAYRTYFVAPAAPLGAADQSPYSLGLGSILWRNALTYLGWTANFFFPTVQSFSDVIDPSVYPWAIGLLVLWLAGLFSRRLRERGWLTGGALWLLFLLPVLPLRNHTYHYYLYAPLAGAAWCVAAAFDAALEAWRRAGNRAGAAPRDTTGSRQSWGASATLAALLTLNGYLLVQKVETTPFVLPELRADPMIDRGRIARNVYDALSEAPLPPGVTLLFWSPTAASIGPHGEPLGGPAAQATYWETNVRDALLGGLAVRVMSRVVGEIRFVREFTPAAGNVRYAVYRPDGQLRVKASAEVDSILKSLPAARATR